MITRHQQPEAGNTAASPDFLGQSAEELHLIVPRQEAGVDHEHRLVDLEQPLLHDRHGPCNQHHQFIPVALSRSGVGLEDQVPRDTRLVGNLLEAVKEKPLEVNELNREPSTELVAGVLVVLRVDQQRQERAFLESAPEAFLELAGIRLLGRDLALVDLPSRGLSP